MGKKMKIILRGPNKNAIFRGYAPRADTRKAVSAVKLKNLLNKHLFNLFIDLYLNLKKIN